MENKSSRIVQLDGLRGIAVLFVVCFHYLNNAYARIDIRSLNKTEVLLKKITYWGWTGVDLFFILSGFLIASILLKNRSSPNYFRTFYIRRMARIVPAYFLLLFLFILARQQFEHTGSKLFANPLDIGWYFAFLQNFQMSIKGSFGAYGIAPTWSLAVEEQFYLIIPLIVYFFSRRHVLVFCLLCMILAPVYRSYSDNWYRTYTHIFSRIDAPCYGVLLALFYKNDEWITLVKKYAWLLLLSVLFALYAFLGLKVKALNHSFISLIYLALTFYVLRLRQGNWGYRLLAAPFLQTMGKYSYFIYLYHILVNSLLFLLLSDFANPSLAGLQGYAVTLLSFMTTWFLAYLSFRFIEGRMIGWSHRFTYQ